MPKPFSEVRYAIRQLSKSSATMLVLPVAAMCAALVRARAASRVEPMRALRGL